MKIIVKIFLIISVCFFGVIFIFKDLIKVSSQNKNTSRNYIICGVGSSEKVSEGKKVFKILCASCHKLEKKLIGPPLLGVDSIVFRSWISYKKSSIDTSKLNISGIDYHRNVFGKQLSENQKKELYKYLTIK